MAIFKGKEVQIVTAPTVDTEKFRLIDNDNFTHTAWKGELQFTEAEKKNLVEQRKRDIDASFAVVDDKELKEIRENHKKQLADERKNDAKI